MKFTKDHYVDVSGWTEEEILEAAQVMGEHTQIHIASYASALDVTEQCRKLGFREADTKFLTGIGVWRKPQGVVEISQEQAKQIIHRHKHDNPNITSLAKSLVKAGDELDQYKDMQAEANKRVEKAQEGYQKALEALTNALVQGRVENGSEGLVERSKEYVIDHSNDIEDNSVDNLQIVSRITIESRVASCLERVIGEFDPNLNLRDELDSLDMIEVIMALEEEFDTEIPDHEAEKFWYSKRKITLEDVVQKMNEQH